MTTINQATNANTFPSIPKRRAFLGDISDFIKLLREGEVKPNFNSITIVTFTDERGKSWPSLTHYKVNGRELSEKKFNDIKELVNNPELRSYDGAQEKGQCTEERLYAYQIKDSAIIAKINHILRNS